LSTHDITSAPEEPDASVIPKGERKTVTALFADIMGSTALMEGLDPEQAAPDCRSSAEDHGQSGAPI
jgi:class 3 adenylate cyclase